MRLLVVEDEPDFLRTLAQFLREEGYAVDLAEDGEEGLYKAEDTDYDAIVLDVMLPRLDGYEVLRRLRCKKKTPVLMLTARVKVPDRIQGLDTGADDYLSKPVDLEELAARLRALVRRAHGVATPAVRIGEVVVDTAARTATLRGEPVVLTGREYAFWNFSYSTGRRSSRARNSTSICTMRTTRRCPISSMSTSSTSARSSGRISS